MPRRERVLIEGGLYHVYNRCARGEGVLADPDEAIALVELLRGVKERDGLTVFAWCVMSNHFHVALRTSAVPLSRSMHFVQCSFSRAFNRRWRRTGPLWQSRYQARLVEDQRYFEQVMLYIHLNPVRAGVVDEPAEYAFSGHRELLGKVHEPLVEVDEALASFGSTLRTARWAYSQRARAALKEGEEWEQGMACSPAAWWPGTDRELRSEKRVYVDELGRSTGLERATLDVESFVDRACSALGVEMERLTGGRRDRETARLRQLVASVGVERWGQRAGQLAVRLGKHPVAVSRWVSEAARRRREDPEFADKLRLLDEALDALARRYSDGAQMQPRSEG